MYLLKTSEGTPKPATWPMWRGPLVYGQATADRTLLMAGNPRRAVRPAAHEWSAVGFVQEVAGPGRVRQGHDWSCCTREGHRRRHAAAGMAGPHRPGRDPEVDGRHRGEHRLAGRQPRHVAGRDERKAVRGQGRGARGRRA